MQATACQKQPRAIPPNLSAPYMDMLRSSTPAPFLVLAKRLRTKVMASFHDARSDVMAMALACRFKS